jgi:hypothetical protein
MVLLAACMGCETAAQKESDAMFADAHRRANEPTDKGAAVARFAAWRERADPGWKEREAKARALSDWINNPERWKQVAYVFPEATPEQQAALLKGWVCPGMPKDMVRAILVNPVVTGEYFSAGRQTETWKWRSWTLFFVNGKLQDFSVWYGR